MSNNPPMEPIVGAEALKSDLNTMRCYARNLIFLPPVASAATFLATNLLGLSPSEQFFLTLATGVTAAFAIGQKTKQAVLRTFKTLGRKLSDNNKHDISHLTSFRTTAIGTVGPLATTIVCLLGKIVYEEIKNPGSHLYKGASMLIEWGCPLAIATIAGLSACCWAYDNAKLTGAVLDHFYKNAQKVDDVATTAPSDGKPGAQRSTTAIEALTSSQDGPKKLTA